MRNKRQIGLFWLLLMMAVFVASVTAQNGPTITFSPTETVNKFPESLTFRTTAVTDQSEIVSAKLLIRNSNFINLSTTMTELEVDVVAGTAGVAGTAVDLEYMWETTNPPSTPFYYRWEVTDADGNIAQTPEELVFYDDTRYDWQILQNDNLQVWWHDRDASFGEEVFAIANQAFAEQEPIFQTALEFPIKIIIYNNFDEFAEWHVGELSEFVGGEAYPNIGVTTQIVSAYGSQSRWLNDVIPHEISHLYLAQASYNPTAIMPRWLDEGLASYNEFSDQTEALAQVQRAADTGDLLPLSSLQRGFGWQSREDQIGLAYNESLHAVTYLVKTYGRTGLADLLAAYKDGQPTNEAFMSALGISFDEFEIDWAASLGLTGYAPPTRPPLPTSRPSPTMMVLATRSATNTPISPVAEPTLVATAVAVEPTAIAETNVTVIVQTPTVGATPTRADKPVGAGSGLCGSPLLLLPLLLWWRPRRKK